MPIQYKCSRFRTVEYKCPYITIYDNDDVEEIISKLTFTDELAASIGDFEFLPIFSKLKMLTVLCGNFSLEGLKKLYRHTQLKALCFDSNYLSDKNDTEGVIDLNYFSNICALYTWEYNVNHLSNAISLRTLGIETVGSDLLFLKDLTRLDSLAVGGKNLKTLQGIENLKLQCVSIDSSKKLKDISSLRTSVDTLEFLRISYCPNIADLSLLSKFKKLKSLSIYGYNGSLDNIYFVDDLPNLNFFVTNYKIINGDIKPLLRLPYAAVLHNYRHYNLKDKDLSRNEDVKIGNENIPIWRQIIS